MSSEPTVRRARILVTEDEPNSRLLLSATLGDEGYEVVTAESAHQAIDLLTGSDFDLLLTDLRMPGSSGIELLQWVRTHRPATDVMLMTGYGSLETAAEGVRLGARDYLLKPFASLDLVVNSVRRVLQEQHLVAASSRLKRSLERAERLGAIGIHATRVAHEIGNPAALLATHNELLLSEIGKLQSLRSRLSGHDSVVVEVDEARALSATLATLAQVGRENAIALASIRSIVGDLQSFAREAYPVDRLDLNDVVRSALILAGPQFRHRAQLVTRLEDLPLLKGNEARLAQVLVSLLTNAAQAVAEREDAVVRVSTRREGRSLVVAVEDNGPGLSEAVRQRIFDPVFSRGGPGHGLGLSLFLAAEIAREQGGTLACQSQPGVGSTFELRLPDGGPAETEPQGVPRREPPPPRPRVLIVDDESLLLRSLKRILDASYAVTACTSGREAAALLATEPFDAVLCDLTMPDLDGAGFHDELLRVRPELAPHLVFVSGGALTERTRSLWDRYPVLRKPFRTSEVLRAISAAVAGSNREP